MNLALESPAETTAPAELPAAFVEAEVWVPPKLTRNVEGRDLAVAVELYPLQRATP